MPTKRKYKKTLNIPPNVSTKNNTDVLSVYSLPVCVLTLQDFKIQDPAHPNDPEKQIQLPFDERTSFECPRCKVLAFCHPSSVKHPDCPYYEDDLYENKSERLTIQGHCIECLHNFVVCSSSKHKKPEIPEESPSEIESLPLSNAKKRKLSTVQHFVQEYCKANHQEYLNFSDISYADISNAKLATLEKLGININKHSASIVHNDLPDSLSENFSSFYKCIQYSHRYIRNLHIQAERKNSFFILQVIQFVCSGFKSTLTIELEDAIESEILNVRGIADMVLYGNDFKLIIVEVKKDDIAKGQAQCFLEVEALASLGNETVYGLVTDYHQWHLCKSIGEKTTFYSFNLSGARMNTGPDESSMKTLCSTLYYFFLENLHLNNIPIE